MNETCFSCGGIFPENPGGAVHPYMSSSPGCWAAYGQVLEREYSHPALFKAAHRLTVDAYALQHPGDQNDDRALQSFWIHGASLWMVLKLGVSHERATAGLKRLAGGSFGPRPEPLPKFASTHAQLLERLTADHSAIASQWAEHALEGWNAAHDEFDRLAKSAIG